MIQEFDRNHFKDFVIENEAIEKRKCSQNHSETEKHKYFDITLNNSFRSINEAELNKAYLLIGSLRDKKIRNLDYIEFNNKEGEFWSVKSKIATNFYPYHVADVYKCKECNKLFLVYTEFGGHWPQLRIRNIKSELIVEEPSNCTLEITENQIDDFLSFLKIENSSFVELLEKNKGINRINTDFDIEEVLVKRIAANNFLIVAKKEIIYALIKSFDKSL